jgi:hypothetical protein
LCPSSTPLPDNRFILLVTLDDETPVRFPEDLSRWTMGTAPPAVNLLVTIAYAAFLYNRYERMTVCQVHPHIILIQDFPTVLADKRSIVCIVAMIYKTVDQGVSLFIEDFPIVSEFHDIIPLP